MAPQTTYGSAFTEFVTKAYADILDRVPDQKGLDYWVGQLESGRLSADSFALAFRRQCCTRLISKRQEQALKRSKGLLRLQRARRLLLTSLVVRILPLRTCLPSQPHPR